MNFRKLKDIALEGEKDVATFQETFNPPTVLALLQTCEHVEERGRSYINELLQEQSKNIDEFRNRLYSSLEMMQALMDLMKETGDGEYPKEAVIQYLEDSIKLGMGVRTNKQFVEETIPETEE